MKLRFGIIILLLYLPVMVMAHPGPHEKPLDLMHYLGSLWHLLPMGVMALVLFLSFRRSRKTSS